jgi:hypothetical protein
MPTIFRPSRFISWRAGMVTLSGMGLSFDRFAADYNTGQIERRSRSSGSPSWRLLSMNARFVRRHARDQF